MMLSQLNTSKALNMVCISDLARFALLAFNNHDQEPWRNSALILAGDLITPDDLKTQFREVKGKSIPTTFETPVKLCEFCCCLSECRSEGEACGA